MLSLITSYSKNIQMHKTEVHLRNQKTIEIDVCSVHSIYIYAKDSKVIPGVGLESSIKLNHYN